VDFYKPVELCFSFTTHDPAAQYYKAVSSHINEQVTVTITSNDVQSNTTSLTNIFIDLGLHVSIH